MKRVVALFLIIGASCGAAWLGSLSRHRWMPGAAFWVTLMVLGTIAQFWFGIDFGND